MPAAERGQYVGAAALTVALVCGACSDDTTEPEWSTDDAVFVLPQPVPDGWTLGVATQRIEDEELSTGETVRFGDYTVGWVREEFAGRDRSDVRSEGPRFWINSGSRFYEDVYWPAIAGGSVTSSESTDEYSAVTPIGREGDISSLVFRVDCCLVSLGATGISDEMLRSIAASVVGLDLDEWQSELGDRLLVDDQT